MKKGIPPIILVLTLLVLVAVGYAYIQLYPGLAPVLSPPPADITDILGIQQESPLSKAENQTDIPLSIPDGFTIRVLADDLPGVRVMAMGPGGALFVSQMNQGVISRLDIRNHGVVSREVFLTGLNNPHGLAFDPEDPYALYIAEENRISKLIVYPEVGPMETVVNLPAGGRHVTRTIGFGPDGRLYVSIGSTCDVCEEQNPMYGSIQVLNEETNTLEPYATGLRNAVFFAWHEVDGSMWATEMGRDGLGDDLPSDEINIIEQGKNYGWPICYGDSVHDTDFDKHQYVKDPCAQTTVPAWKLPAHVAPLGIGIIPESTVWPEEYWYDVIVSEHGSWNRSVPVGYQLSRLVVNSNMEIERQEPFVSGWLTADGRALGRPVDVLVTHAGEVFVSDDKAGVIYRIVYDPEPQPIPLRWDGEIPFEIDKTSEMITFSAETPGTMFFEASFPVTVKDASGNIVYFGLATADGEWMTEAYVPFTASLEKQADPSTETGTMIFQRDNPSGLPEHDSSFEVPVVFVSPE